MIKEILNGEVKKAINCVREKDANITKTGQTVDVGFFPIKYLKIKYIPVRYNIGLTVLVLKDSNSSALSPKRRKFV